MQKLWKLKACVSEKARRKHEAKIWKKSGKKKKFLSGTVTSLNFQLHLLKLRDYTIPETFQDKHKWLQT